MNGGDLTRSTFRAHRHYSGVRMQQGRVQLDADWNEQLDVSAHRDRTEAVDVIGAAGVPKVGGGFEVSVAPGDDDLLLTPGRAWVGGLLCEADGVLTAVTGVPSATSVTVDSLVLDGVQLQPQSWVEILGATGDPVVTRVAAVDVASRTLTLSRPVGSLTRNLMLRRRLSYATQTDLPAPDGTTRASSAVPRVLNLADGTYLAFLDVWERDITGLDDPDIVEPALAVDTTTRTRIVWQLRLLDVGGIAPPVGCDSDFRAALAGYASATGRLAARAKPPEGSPDLCRPTPAGGYVGLENQLYRIQVHDLDAGRPVVVWSRENGSVVSRWLDNAATDLLDVSSIGRDAVLGFKSGDWVELYDDSNVLHRRPGTLVRLVDAKGTQLTLDLPTATGSTDHANFPRNAMVRRWDSPGAVTASADDWIALDELGVEVRFPLGGTFHRGDYWLVPARSALADIVWPHDSGGEPLAQPPDGVAHSIGKLAIVTCAGGKLTVTDCRTLVPALNALTADDVSVSNTICKLPGVHTVQDAVDALCQRPAGTCSVTVGPGDDLGAAVARLPADGGELCFHAGTYTLGAALVISGRSRIVMRGAGPATVLRALGTEAALQFQDCTEVAVHSMRVEGGVAGTAADWKHLSGAITFLGGGELSVTDCVLCCPDAPPETRGQVRRTQTCLTARAGAQPLRVRVERNRFEVGTLQTGLLVVDPAHALVAGNSLRVSGSRDPRSGRVAGQGVVIGGGAVGTVEIFDNLVEDTIQGIHVAASGPAAGRELADAVLISRNVVRAKVPAGHKRDRHAVFVGNARSVHVTDTVAVLERTGEGTQTPVDAVRLYGVFGPFLTVRQTSVSNFTVGVHVEALEPVPSPRMWLVAETMADGGELGAHLPDIVQRERNYPEHPVVATLALAPAYAKRRVGTSHTITATARDATGAPVVGVAIRFSVRDPSNIVIVREQSARTGANGVALLSYTGRTAGRDTVSAYADSNDNGRQDPGEPSTLASVEYVAAAPASVALAQDTNPSPCGSRTAVVATVRADDQSLVPDARVVFTVTGANPTSEGQTVSTNATGQALFAYAGQHAGNDTVHASVEGTTLQATIEHTYETRPASISLLPAVGTALAGSDVSFAATVLDTVGGPMPGVTVGFRVTGANPRTTSIATNNDGIAVLRYTGTTAGTDEIVAFVDQPPRPGEPQSRPAVQTFTQIPAKDKTAVPDLTDMSQFEASAALNAAGLRLGAVQVLPNRPRPPGLYDLRGPFVERQSHAAGTLVEKETVIMIAVRSRWEERSTKF